MYSLLGRFHNTGTVDDLPRSGRIGISDDKVMEITDTAAMNPTIGTNRMSQMVDVSQSSVYRVLKKTGHKPYKKKKVHQMKDGDDRARLHFCNWFLNHLLVRRGEAILDRTIFSDEPWFYLDYPGNSQNNIVWAKENPHVMVEKVSHASKVGVWCGVSRTRVFGPFFFTARQTINEERYRTLILEPFVAELSEDEIEFSLFQQDGATAHTARGHCVFWRRSLQTA